MKLGIVDPSPSARLMLNEVGRGEAGARLRVIVMGWPRLQDFHRRVAEYVTDGIVIGSGAEPVLVRAVTTGLAKWEEAKGGERLRMGVYLETLVDNLVVMAGQATLTHTNRRQWTMAGGLPLQEWATGIPDWRHVVLNENVDLSREAAVHGIASYCLIGNEVFLEILKERGYGGL